MSKPETGWAASAASELADLEEIWETLDIPGHRVELIDGQLIVSPSASLSHSSAIDKLIDTLIDTKREHGWRFHTNLTVHITPTRERLIPDLMIAPKDAPGFGDNELLASGVLLVVEVVSPSSRRQDRVAKPRAYAQGRIPLYLLIDQIAEPAVALLFSDPADDGYRSCERASSGQPLYLPEPFAIRIDASDVLTA
jgi:Uma2 family endonuclease